MRLQRIGHAIGVSLIGLTLLLTAPDIGASQDVVRSGLSADKPLSYHLSALHSNSWLTRNGIWVRHDGMWAFRPTWRPDWQAYFRCQAGHGCGGVGWASHSFWSWLPYGYGGWDLVPGGWMWFPGQRLATSRAWDLFGDLWFFGPKYGFGAYGSGPWTGEYGFGPHFRGMTLARTDQGFVPAHRIDEQRRQATIDYQRRQATLTSSITAPTTPSIDPVRIGPRVEPRSAGVSPRSARQEKGKSGESLGRERYRPPAPSATGKLKSPRSPAARIPATGQSKIKKPTSPRFTVTGTKATGQSKSTGKKAPEH